ncbi:ABC transporter ATP-binding protein [Bacillus sp. mrc49]|uniref:ABC transporter ATP-binding protein n=1 Tax=Bacillus sp. mrc49 TaxID=2054913 RepID=UPI000C27921C|nr:ABC transporter ATP-binding protein [Bacillus sp. mrc49]PJN91609.1 glutathione ABC transporter ATP-binding protein [Bacillus sp. mrc49]
MDSLLDVKDLTVDFKTKNGLLTAVSKIDLQINDGETVCIVGESGSGKSVTSKAIMRLIDYENGQISGGQILFNQEDLVSMSKKGLNQVRGKKISMVFQEPLSAFDPVFTIGHQLTETMIQHTKVTKKQAWEKGTVLLKRVGISEPEIRMKQYPSELSGGMLQRAMIAMALACEPELLIADEPTTSLDVTIQAQIIDLLKELKKEFNMAILLVTHDLGVALQLADRIVVMYAGKVVEEGTVQQLFQTPYHPYTRGLLQSIPKFDSTSKTKLHSIEGSIPGLPDMPEGCRFHPRCPFSTEKCQLKSPPLSLVNGRYSACWYAKELVKDERWFSDSLADHDSVRKDKSPAGEKTREVIETKALFEIRELSKYYPLKHSSKQIKAVDNVSFSIIEGETFGLVGESGSGKSTLGRAILQLERMTTGDVVFKGQSLTQLKSSEMRKMRKNMQMIFQDPYGSIDPRWTIGKVIAEPIKVHQPDLTIKQVETTVKELLKKVGLKPEWYSRFPHEFSGGQRQRIGIARAIAVNPTFILADEAVSALDVSVRAQIINLLKDLQQSLKLTYLFIGHDLNIVRYISDRIGVMYLGKMVEIAPSEELFNRPAHPYTEALIKSIPHADLFQTKNDHSIHGEIPSPANPPSGCGFRTRCPFATERCTIEVPELKEFEPGRFVSCHHSTLVFDRKK